jgi:Fur family ferric uptake transcriptional regulator
MTAQRRTIVSEIMKTTGHIAPQLLVRRVKKRLPGVHESTVYRTLELLEELGILSHAHLESGAEYHHRAEHDHVHLVCSQCGRNGFLTIDETEPLRRMIHKRSGWAVDLTHFAIAGLCERCEARARNATL